MLFYWIIWKNKTKPICNCRHNAVFMHVQNLKQINNFLEILFLQFLSNLSLWLIASSIILIIKNTSNKAVCQQTIILEFWSKFCSLFLFVLVHPYPALGHWFSTLNIKKVANETTIRQNPNNITIINYR